MADVGVVIAAAGMGSRMNSEVNKPYVVLGSKPILAHSLAAFERCELVDEIIVVANRREIDYCHKEVIQRFGFKKVSDLTEGGETRQDSVWQGLQKLGPETRYAAIHDGARPLLSQVLLRELIAQARLSGAAIPGLPLYDTIKRIDSAGQVLETIDRTGLYSVQTPQVFNYSALLKAYHLAGEEGFEGTDDAMLYQKYIGGVKIVKGDYRNIKITTRKDLVTAQIFLDQISGGI